MSGRRRNVGANSIVYSGRGRPRTKETVDRPLPVGIVLGTPSPGSDIFKNRKIRVGGAFQAKVPKKPLASEDEEGGEEVEVISGYRSSRRAPQLMSKLHPDFTQDEVNDWEQQELSRKKQKEAFPTKKEEGEDPSSMEIDTSLSQATAATEEGTAISTATTTTSPDSISFHNDSNNCPKPTTTDRQQQSDTNSQQDNNSLTTSDNGKQPSNDNKNKDKEEGCLTTRRGGLLIHPRGVWSTSIKTEEADVGNTANSSFQQEGDEFWDFAQPLMMAPVESGPKERSNAWQWEIHQWYVDQDRKRQQAEDQRKEELEQQKLLEQSMPRRRGRRKRKKEPASSAAALAEQENILDWYEEERLHKKLRGTGMHLAEEDRAHAMQHLWLRHQGQAATAKVETMVQLSAGKAEMARKVKQLKRRRATRGGTLEPLSWRKYCEQSTIHAMTGDFRETKGSTGSMKQVDPIDDVQVHQEVWKSILKFGQCIEENLNKAACNGRRHVQLLKFSTLTSFLNNAYLVRPVPEDIYRASSVPLSINECFDTIASYVDQARKVQAQLMDLLYETNEEGVDLDALQKLLDQSRRSLALELDDAKVLHEQVDLGLEWQRRLDAMVAETDLCLSSLEDLAKEGQSFAFRTKSLVCLENRIQKAYQLRDRIMEWRKGCSTDNEDNLDDKKECVKVLHAMVREANRLKLSFPEVAELRETHRSVEAWIDRANIAIRSRISLTEIKDLIERGESMPVDLSDSMEKLRARENLAEEWIKQFEEIVPRPDTLPSGTCDESDESLLLWMRGMRNALNNGKYAHLHDIASEGSRIPVEVDIVKLLQLELDAKNWTTKAKKWVPSLVEGDSSTCKKAKLDDLREHLGKAVVLKDRLDLSAAAKETWTLDGEAEIRAIVQAADDWFAKYKPYLDWDNRRSLGRSCLSLDTLRTIVDEGNAIHANIGNAIGKMTRILAQADGWVKENEALLLTCKIIPLEGSTVQPLDKRFVTLEGMTAVSEAAGSEVSLDLDEAKQLLELVEAVKDWSNRVANAAPKRSVRGRGRKAKFTVDDIIGLIKEATNIPVDTTEDINRLQIQLSGVQEWRAKAREKLEEIANGFIKLRHVVDEMYGAPTKYSRIKSDKAESNDDEKSDEKGETGVSEEKKVPEDMSAVSASTACSEPDNEGIPNFGNGNCNVNQLIKAYRREAKAFGVASGEVEAAERLEKVSNWSVKSLKYLVNQRDVFDKRFFGAFDRFVGEGRVLIGPQETSNANAVIELDDEALAQKLNTSWTTFVAEQLQRLDVLVADREQFSAWCNYAEAQLLSGDKRPSLEKLKDVSDRSRAFPAVCDMVQKVRGQYNKALEWKEATRKRLQGEEKISPIEAKCILENGEKLGFLCEEMKNLRNAIRAARNWSNRFKKCKVEQGSTNANAVQDLIDEHDKLLLELPEEVSQLKQAMQSYCLCRRPYSGFMIGCDECEEWYHGSCIGITESKADRFDKYVCIRCSLCRVFKNTAKEAVGIVRKWTCIKDMKKARAADSQKHQRKVRKETKDIEKHRAEIQSLEASQTEQAMDLKNEIPAAKENPSVPPVPAVAPTIGATPPNRQEVQNAAGNQTSKQTPNVPKLSPAEAQAKIDKAHDAIRQCGERLARLSEKSEERKAILCIEDSKAPLLRNWCLRVRSLVLVPRSDECAEDCRPMQDGSLARPMLSLMDEALEAGIASVGDVEAMDNAFRCMAWCLLATRILARKPTMTEMEMLVTKAKGLKLTEEKALRMIKAMLLRAKAWQGKVLKALAPCPGETKAFNVDSLKELQTIADEIPLILKEEALLSGVVEDGGARHCVCKGPTDARFMLSCDKCERWFHGPCVDMTKEKCEVLSKWVCPPCKGSLSPVDASNSVIVWEDRDDPRQAKKRRIASEAPDPVQMWPPFGLFGSEQAREVLGEDCSAIADVVSTVAPMEEPRSVSSQAPAHAISQPEAVDGGSDTMMLVPPTTLVQSADVSQELNMPLSQGLPPPNCALLADTDADVQAQAQLAASSLKSTLEFSQQQAFNQWLAATQVNLAQPQAPAFGWQPNPFLSVAATAAAAASISNQTALSLGSAQNSTASSSATAPTQQGQLSALETLAQMANNQHVSNTEAQKPKATPMDPPPAVGAAENGDSTVQNSCTTQQFLSTVPAAATSIANDQPQLQSPNALNQLPSSTALNLIVAALPVQESGS